eukprot:g59897.t1
MTGDLAVTGSTQINMALSALSSTLTVDTLCVNGAAIFKATTAITGMMTVQGMLTVKPSEWGSTGVFKVTDGSNVNVLQVGASGDMCSECSKVYVRGPTMITGDLAVMGSTKLDSCALSLYVASSKTAIAANQGADRHYLAGIAHNLLQTAVSTAVSMDGDREKLLEAEDEGLPTEQTGFKKTDIYKTQEDVYQNEFMHPISFDKFRYQLVNAVTGLGKSHASRQVILQLLRANPEARVCIVTGRRTQASCVSGDLFSFLRENDIDVTTLANYMDAPRDAEGGLSQHQRIIVQYESLHRLAVQDITLTVTGATTMAMTTINGMLCIKGSDSGSMETVKVLDSMGAKVFTVAMMGSGGAASGVVVTGTTMITGNTMMTGDLAVMGSTTLAATTITDLTAGTLCVTGVHVNELCVGEVQSWLSANCRPAIFPDVLPLSVNRRWLDRLAAYLVDTERENSNTGFWVWCMEVLLCAVSEGSVAGCVSSASSPQVAVHALRFLWACARVHWRAQGWIEMVLRNKSHARRAKAEFDVAKNYGPRREWRDTLQIISCYDKEPQLHQRPPALQAPRPGGYGPHLPPAGERGTTTLELDLPGVPPLVLAWKVPGTDKAGGVLVARWRLLDNSPGLFSMGRRARSWTGTTSNTAGAISLAGPPPPPRARSRWPGSCLRPRWLSTCWWTRSPPISRICTPTACGRRGACTGRRALCSRCLTGPNAASPTIRNSWSGATAAWGLLWPRRLYDPHNSDELYDGETRLLRTSNVRVRGHKTIARPCTQLRLIDHCLHRVGCGTEELARLYGRQILLFNVNAKPISATASGDTPMPRPRHETLHHQQNDAGQDIALQCTNYSLTAEDLLMQESNAKPPAQAAVHVRESLRPEVALQFSYRPRDLNWPLKHFQSNPLLVLQDHKPRRPFAPTLAKRRKPAPAPAPYHRGSGAGAPPRRGPARRAGWSGGYFPEPEGSYEDAWYDDNNNHNYLQEEEEEPGAADDYMPTPPVRKAKCTRRTTSTTNTTTTTTPAALDTTTLAPKAAAATALPAGIATKTTTATIMTTPPPLTAELTRPLALIFCARTRREQGHLHPQLSPLVREPLSPAYSGPAPSPDPDSPSFAGYGAPAAALDLAGDGAGAGTDANDALPAVPAPAAEERLDSPFWQDGASQDFASLCPPTRCRVDESSSGPAFLL